jgi:hypothetical protein
MDPNWIVAGAAVVAALATVKYALVAANQLRAMNEQAGLLRQQVAHQIELERPRLNVKGDGEPYIIWEPTREDPDRCWIMVPWTVQNVGRSPAFLYRLTVRIEVVDDMGPFDPPPLGDETPPFGAIPVTTTIPHSNKSMRETDPRTAREVGPGLSCILVYGIARYKDVREKDHFDQFAFVWHLVSPIKNVWTYVPSASRDFVKSD